MLGNGSESKEAAIERFGEAGSLAEKTTDIDIYLDTAGAPAILETFQQMGKIDCRMAVAASCPGSLSSSD